MKRLTKEEARPHNTPDTNDTNSGGRQHRHDTAGKYRGVVG